MSFVRFASAGDVPPGRSKSVRIGLRHIAVFNLGGTLHAIEDACAHMKAPLSGGRVNGSRVTCARHGWSFDLASGRRVDAEGGCVRTFPVKVENGTIFVDPEICEPLESDGDEIDDGIPPFPATS